MAEFQQDLSSCKFEEAIEELGLVEHYTNPYFLDPDGNIVLFRGQSRTQENLNLSFGENAVYGLGSYLANVPSAVSPQAYGYEDRGVAVYKLPTIDLDKIEIKKTSIGVESSTACLVLFPAPFISRVTRVISYKGRKQDKFMSPKWALLKEEYAMHHILGATKIAWLGQACIGTPRP
jgi:hypothetical protein